MAEVAFPEYTYLAVLGIIFGFSMAFWIGANDVANAFGSSVSAGSLSLKNAVILGSIMEFSGSVLLGANVAGTIRGGIIDSSFYKEQPEVFMLGSCTALMAASLWLMIATHLQFAVSTTHDIVAAMIGFSLAAHGFESIIWPEVTKIFISWAAAPSFAGLIGFIFFKTLQVSVLHAENTFDRALLVFPVIVFCAIGVNMFFILFKATKNVDVGMDDWEWGHYVVLPTSLGGGFVLACITHFIITPKLKSIVEREYEEAAAKEAEKVKKLEAGSASDNEDLKKDFDVEVVDVDDPAPKARGTMHTETDVTVEDAPEKSRSVWDKIAENTYRQDLKSQAFAENERCEELWGDSEIYDPKTERLFQYLQVFTACLAAFAHGTNDVANAIAPLSAILDIWRHGEFKKKAPVAKWILCMGGAGIALGFAIYGYKIIKAVGYKLTMITPSRGFCIELAAALAVSLASFMKIPVSTTQCLVGATTGVGFASGGWSQVNGPFLARTSASWVGIFFIACIVNAGLFAFVAYSPTLVL